MNDREVIVSIRRLIEFKSREERELPGELLLNNPAVVDLLQRALKDEKIAITCGLAVLCDSDSEIQLGERITLRLFQPTLIRIFKDAHSYNADEANIFNPTEFYYLEKEDWANWESHRPDSVGVGELIQEFLSVLKSAALFVNLSSRSLVFPDVRGVVEIPIKIDALPEPSLWSTHLRGIIEFMRDELHVNHKKAALVQSVVYLTRAKNHSDRFTGLLEDASGLYDRCVSEYSIFLSAFSFEKVREEAEAIRVDFTARIHHVLSEIQGQLLGLPAAAIVIATQLKPTTELGATFVANIGVLVASMLFAWLISVLVKNQGQTLRVIENDSGRRHAQFKAELNGAASELDEVFSYLAQRIQHQRKALRSIDRVTLVGAAITIVSFLYATKDVLTS